MTMCVIIVRQYPAHPAKVQIGTKIPGPVIGDDDAAARSTDSADKVRRSRRPGDGCHGAMDAWQTGPNGTVCSDRMWSRDGFRDARMTSDATRMEVWSRVLAVCASNLQIELS